MDNYYVQRYPKSKFRILSSLQNWVSNRLAYKFFNRRPWGLYTLKDYSTCLFWCREGYEKIEMSFELTPKSVIQTAPRSWTFYESYMFLVSVLWSCSCCFLTGSKEMEIFQDFCHLSFAIWSQSIFIVSSTTIHNIKPKLCAKHVLAFREIFKVFFKQIVMALKTPPP